MRSNCNDHLRADPAQAAMVDGSIPVTARAALDRSPDYGVAFLIEWCPTSIIRRAEDRNTQSVNGTGNVSGAGVIADKERSEERRVGKGVDLGGRRIIKKKKKKKKTIGEDKKKRIKNQRRDKRESMTM